MLRPTRSPYPSLLRLWRAARAAFAPIYERLRDTSLVLESWRHRGLSPETRRLRARINALGIYVRKLVLAEARALALAWTPPAARKKPAKRGRHYQRPAAFRLWPRPERAPARIRSLGPPLSLRAVQRERARQSLARLRPAAQAARRQRRAETSERERLIARLLALAAVLRQPMRAIRRMARRLRTQPRLSLKLAAARVPRPESRLDPIEPSARHEVETLAYFAARDLIGNTS